MTSNTFGNAPSDPSNRSPSWLWPFAPMAVATFSLSALIFYHLRLDRFEVRSALQHAYAAIYRIFGFAPAVMFFGLVAIWSTIWLVHGRLERPLQRLGRLAAMAVLLGVLLNLGDGGVAPALHKGALGGWIAGALVAAVGYWPSLVVVWGFTFGSLLLATDFFFHDSFERMLAGEPDQPVAAVAAGASAAALAAPAAAIPSAALASSDASDASGAAAAPLPASDEASTWRRRSYYERRAERVAAGERWREADDGGAATPAAASAAEDELSAARVVDAIDAAEHADGEAIAAEETEALDRDAEPALGDAAAADVAASPAAPIVFPDGVVEQAGEDRAQTESAEAPAASAATDAAADDIDLVIFDEDEDVATDPAGGAAVAAAGDGDAADILFAADAAAFAPGEAWGAAAGPEPTADGTPASEFIAPDDDPIAATTPADEALAPARAAESPPEPTAHPLADPIVTIPRPEVPAASGAPDEALMREAVELVLTSRRANAVFLQRKLRVDYDLATAVLHQLAARGIVALDAEATHGRILV
jgi:hypothetical protein